MRNFVISLVLVGGAALAATAWAGDGAHGSDEGLAKQVAALNATLAEHAMRITKLEARLAKFEAAPTVPAVPAATPLDIETFRKMLEGVEKARRDDREAQRAKRSADRLRSRLDGLDVELSPAQKEDLVALSAKHNQRTRDAFAQLREAGADRQAYRAAVETLREKLKAEVEKVVPGDASETVFQALSSGRGVRTGSNFGGSRGR